MPMKTSFPMFWGLAPKEGPKCLPIEYDFSSVASHDDDLVQEGSQGVIDEVQGVYIDNSLNANALTITFAGSQYAIRCPAYASLFYPVFAPRSLRWTIATTIAADLTVQIVFTNVPIPLAQSGPVTSTTVLATGSFTDRSIAALSGASEQLMAANANRKRLVVQNPTLNANPIYVNYGAAAAADQTSFEILPGGAFDSNFGPVTTQVVNVIGTAGDKVVAKEM